MILGVCSGAPGASGGARLRNVGSLRLSRFVSDTKTTPGTPRGRVASHGRTRALKAGEAGGRPDPRSIAALITVQALFGFHYLAAKIVLETIPPRPWAFIRAGSAALLLLAFISFRGLALPKGRGKLLRFAGLALLGVAINQYLFVEGLYRTSPGHSALINTSIPVLVLLFAVLAGKERPTAGRLLGIGITLFGVLVLIGPAAFGSSAASVTGDLLTFMNGLSYSLFLVLGKPILEREKTLPASALLLALGALWLLPLGAPGLAALEPAAIDRRTSLLAAFIVLGPTIGAYALSTYALRRVESSVVAFFIYLQPLIGAGLSIALGFERPALPLFLSAAIVFLGVFVALRARPVRGAAPPITPEP